MYEPVFTVDNLIYIAVLFVALIITFLFTPFTKIIATKTGAIDVPDGERKFHREPTPRLGGIAIAIGFCVVAVCAALLINGEISRQLLVTIIGGVVICCFGIVDDIFNLSAGIKLVIQICIATVTAILGGAIEYTTIFGKTIILGAWSLPLTVLWIVLIINSMNLIDGLDGLACGVSFLSAFSLLIIAILMGDVVCAIIAAALCGSALGFLPYNANPAAVFMGDSGSTLFGYVLACLSVFGFFKGATLMSTVAPALVFALPLIDVIAAVFDRVSHKKNPFKPDRSHLHYKLMDIGFSQRQAVAIIYIASTVFCGAAIISLYYKTEALIVAGAMFLLLFFMKHIDRIIPLKSDKEKKPRPAAVSDAVRNDRLYRQTADIKAQVPSESGAQTIKAADYPTANTSGGLYFKPVLVKKSAGSGRVAASIVAAAQEKKLEELRNTAEVKASVTTDTEAEEKAEPAVL